MMHYKCIHPSSLISCDYISYGKYENSISLKPAQNKIKENRSAKKSEKVNLAILYRNGLDPEKQTITQELYGQMLPGDQVWMKEKS